ncbi:sugar transferase [Christiangramia echinicola]|uniref:sugar transferase n=1 Tax=Christiangramia echinicola TaxID=279359 RepID=UPI0003F79FAF|nr:sugar transferase [Christiangramia echinicola]
MYRKIIKPAIDFTVAFISLVIISPILLSIIILLSLANNGRPFFFQKRPGKFGRNFKIVKFKTMTDATDKNGSLLPDAERLTYIGKIVRKTSIDEIPQLFNVVKGDMSIIGPRPLLPEYLALYDEEQKKRHDVKPGITGWAQVNGRNAISWTQKFEYDIWYVENQSFILDFKILMKTIKKVLVSEGINTANMATTEPFNGNN